MSVQELRGDFWIKGRNDRRRPGVLSLEKEAAPLLTVTGALTSMMRLVEVVGTGDEAVSEYEPSNDRTLYTIHGSLNDGTAVTVLQAQNRVYRGGFRPDNQIEELRGSHAVIGAQLTGRDHEFGGIRVRLQAANVMLSGLITTSSTDRTPMQSGGRLYLELDGEDIWLVLEDITPRTLRGLDRQFLRPICTLLSLGTGEQVGLLELQVRQDEASSWWPVHSAAQQESDRPTSPSSLLRKGDISPSVIATWFDQVEKLGPLPPVVAVRERGSIALESRILELTTVSEGLHRRLRPNAFRFPEETGVAVRDAAVEAAEHVQAGAGQAVRGFLAYVYEVGYGRRLVELAEMVEPIIPDVTGRTSRWKNAVYEARNAFAHRATTDWFEDADYDKYVTVALSLQWLLRALLLREAGEPLEFLAARFREHTEYQLFLEQAKSWQPRIYRSEEPNGV
jgi:Apea-like HEPN